MENKFLYMQQIHLHAGSKGKVIGFANIFVKSFKAQAPKVGGTNRLRMVDRSKGRSLRG